MSTKVANGVAVADVRVRQPARGSIYGIGRVAAGESLGEVRALVFEPCEVMQGELLGVAMSVPGSLTPGVINALRYILGVVIRSFGSKDTERLWRRERVRSIDLRIHSVALRKLRQVGAAEILDDLRVPPGNRLESLKGDRSGQYSIRINDQWRICFVWTDAGPEEVEIVDYH